MKYPRRCILFLLLAVLVLQTGCQSTYYAVWEKLGKEKRHLLQDQIEDARDEQIEAAEEFKDALTRIKELNGFDGGDLEKAYDRLSDDYDNCRERAAQVEERIEKVERVAKDLFTEWEEEIDQIQKAEFRIKSHQKLKATKAKFARLDKAMHTASARMAPILATQKDYVLFLKHNLNAQAIGSLEGEVKSIASDIDLLVRDTERSIQEAEAFLKEFKG